MPYPTGILPLDPAVGLPTPKPLDAADDRITIKVEWFVGIVRHPILEEIPTTSLVIGKFPQILKS